MRSDENLGSQVAVQNADPQALATQAPAMATRHVYRSPGPVDENETQQIDNIRTVEPFLPPLQVRVMRVLLRMMQ